ncbi:tetratricopeptide repeat protein [Lacinutrix neustonica]|uniref:Tetratricopeptide repeat protein n=1 Tax=Lacinutrix neustonica TaxID=2980107 RepID=A0A9E8SD47_9FLAO|nr:tetratricopeptide repeat protein [Lacinutrix neustonica]WAC01322.1 tetratricopeptide repeat protein [Lacinutrix neustonica]
MKQYDKALEYNDLALKYANKLKDGYYYKLSTAGSIASIYRRKGDYETAINKYSQILENENLLAYDSSFYATTISNRAHSKFLSGIKNKNDIEKPFREAIEISKAVDNYVTEIYTYFYLSKYFESIKETDSAKKYIDKAYKISKSYKMNDFLLETLVFNASLKRDSSEFFLKEHIKLNDSLISAERSIRNKFARINLETDKIQKEKEIVSETEYSFNCSVVYFSHNLTFILCC